jgi:hypothetical protein
MPRLGMRRLAGEVRGGRIMMAAAMLPSASSRGAHLKGGYQWIFLRGSWTVRDTWINKAR